MFFFLYKFFNINIFSYLTSRAGLAFFIAFVLTIKFMPKFITWARNKKANQPIYELAPQSHQNKCKTPTMGGIIFTLSAVISSILCVDLASPFAIGGIMCLAGFAYIGFKDDYAKIIGGKNHDGMSAKTKFALQILISLFLAIFLLVFTNLNMDIYIPFYKYPIINLKYFIVLFWLIVITASSNAVNLTDGLDGLASIPSIFSLMSLATFIYLSGHAIFSEYLFLPKIVGIGEVIIICAALIGSLLGFLWYNCYPAEVFMGDSGSLSVGAFIGYCAVISKNEFLLILIGFVFVLETMSVILQVGSFKFFKKRIFLMAPIHHHFELKGWVENKIIIRFWIIALIANIIALASIKLR
ncbi:phospho-N-acetylmuramoyl-pentapeptide transferase [Campylobacter blaseri]|uniref:Phospho-N-acetylmuramoyl-pentapeptide-transferase n=1 Tax=Campylobacter blaseri TaxID=2042961 RepID=A0A2P8R198_9BACT|nr:phospho-N-acetylmuramoyl-pentapeptide-transferase [Campylobacter blaseri]PSM52273.1 phospho-N-acetylmuramoyl-pentapeptide-transferase [Campylobacter blaseri]PSM54039.1 phospho-N-acetylmuramoyl-pentapeptide-transferase [Campylobacter blaseri]QKF85480.1 phospho-N-acetylmuramoyl-pentapeptide transferase [Campylobacter blaseri]